MKLFELLQQQDEALISPLDPDYKSRLYPALVRTEKGYADRETGKVFPRDKDGKQRSRIKDGKAVGRRIVNDDGIPFGTLKYTVVERTQVYIKAKEEALASGNTRLVYVTEKGISQAVY